VTRMRWDKSGIREPDPGAVTTLPDGPSVDHWITPQERARRRIERAFENERLLERSEIHRYKAMIKKYGKSKAILMGVPQVFVATQLAAKLRNQERQKRAELKRAASGGHKGRK
jgi:hypothetical protein